MFSLVKEANELEKNSLACSLVPRAITPDLPVMV